MSKKSKEKNKEKRFAASIGESVEEAKLTPAENGSQADETKAEIQPAVKQIKTVASISDEERCEELVFRYPKPKEDVVLAQARFGWSLMPHKKLNNCFTVYDNKNGKSLGIIPRIRFSEAFNKANLFQNKHQEALPISNFDQEDFKEIQKEFKAFNKKDEKTFMIQDFLNLREIEFEESFIHKGIKIKDLIVYAVWQDIEESLKMKKLFKKIKKYPFKIALEEKYGGIFSPEDAAILRANGIKYLNDVRKLNVYDYKNLFLSHSITTVPKEVNAAIKRDWERRKDGYFKVYPYITETLTLLPIFIIGLIYKYTLIKNPTMTAVVFSIMAVWIIAFLSSIYGGVRAVRRRNKDHVYYCYFTKGVTTVFVIFVLCSLVTLGLNTLYYERYDGYDNVYYYRDFGDGIAIAGLFDTSVTEAYIPEQIDEKTVCGIDRKAFKNSVVKTVVIPEGVTTIVKKAFIGCKNLEKVSLSETLTEIGDNAFQNCVSLYQIDLKHVETIGKEAFKNCAFLGKVQLGTTITSLGAGAFENCYKLVSCNASGLDNFSKIEDRLFYDCFSLTATNLLSGATCIGKEAFYGCSSIQEITVSNQVEYIGEHAFYDCPSLNTLTLPFLGANKDKQQKFAYFCNVTASEFSFGVLNSMPIPANFFNGSRGINKITLTSNVTGIGENAFENCSNLTSVVLPYDCEYIGEGAFKGCSSLCTISGSEKVTVLGNSVFQGCTFLYSVDLSALEKVGDYCFADCRGLHDINFNNLDYIGDYAFMNCNSIEKLNCNVSDLYLGEGAFAECRNLSVISFNGLKKIPNFAFKGCNNLYYLNNTYGVEHIGEGAFKGCNSLSSPSNLMSDSLNYIGKEAFYGCYGFSEITIPESVTYIGENSFANEGVLQHVSLPFFGNEREREKGYGYIFGDSSYVEKLAVTIYKFDTKYFENAGSVKELVISGDVTELCKNAFVGLTSVTTISLPTSIETVHEGAFLGLSELTSIILPDTMECIEDSTFEGCNSIVNISGGRNVKKLGKNAFKDCYNLANIDFVNAESIGESCFENCRAFTGIEGDFACITELGNKAFKNSGIKRFSAMVKIVGEETFAGSNIETLSLPIAVEFGDSAFYNCMFLQNLTFPVSLEKIGKNCFAYSAISLVDLSATNVHSIRESAFSWCTELVEVALSNNQTVLEARTFEYDFSMANISLGNGLTKICSFAFGECTALSDLVIPNSVTRFDKNALANLKCSVSLPFIGKTENNWFRGWKYLFGNGSDVYKITITKAKSVSARHFRGADNLTSVVLNSVEIIKNRAFYGLENLKSVTFSDRLQSIGKKAFAYCSSLSTLIIPDSVTYLGNSFAAYSGIASIQLPLGITEISARAFEGCYHLDSVQIPDSVVKIGRNAIESWMEIK